jgi:hypothetical protein
VLQQVPVVAHTDVCPTGTATSQLLFAAYTRDAVPVRLLLAVGPQVSHASRPRS